MSSFVKTAGQCDAAEIRAIRWQQASSLRAVCFLLHLRCPVTDAVFWVIVYNRRIQAQSREERDGLRVFSHCVLSSFIYLSCFVIASDKYVQAIFFSLNPATLSKLIWSVRRTQAVCWHRCWDAAAVAVNQQTRPHQQSNKLDIRKKRDLLENLA